MMGSSATSFTTSRTSASVASNSNPKPADSCVLTWTGLAGAPDAMGATRAPSNKTKLQFAPSLRIIGLPCLLGHARGPSGRMSAISRSCIGGLQVADAPLARQPADAKPAALAGEGRSSAASGKPVLWRRSVEPAPASRRKLIETPRFLESTTEFPALPDGQGTTSGSDLLLYTTVKFGGCQDPTTIKPDYSQRQTALFWRCSQGLSGSPEPQHDLPWGRRPGLSAPDKPSVILVK